MEQRQQVPLKIVGGNQFGRYPKISVEETFNMLISDDSLVVTGGYSAVLSLVDGAKGRAIYSSSRGGFMIAVVGGNVFRIDPNLSYFSLGTIATTSGDVFIAENNGGQIAITDNYTIYVYDYGTAPLSPVTALSLTFYPGYISFQNNRLIVAATDKATGNSSWRLSALNNATSWPSANANIGLLQSKPDKVQAAVPFPGRGNLLFLFGKTVAESWTDVGAALFPYQRSSNFTVDFGCLSPATIAELDTYIVWLGGNEQSGAVIMYSTGGSTQKISTDGIDFKLATLTAPQDSFGFLYRQDGHVIYQVCFYTDNLSYIYDFNTQKFFTVTDENLNYHIARQVVFFNNKYYFVSTRDANLYEFGTQFTNYAYASDNVHEIPRIRNTPPLRLATQEYMIAANAGFTIENGQFNQIETITYDPIGLEIILTTENSVWITTEDSVVLVTDQDNDPSDDVTYTLVNMAIDLKTSYDGGENFGTAQRYELNPTGDRKSRLIWYGLGLANDLTMQFQFWGLGRFVAFDGIIEVYK